MKKPLYELPHGLIVIGEYAPRGENRYWRVRIRPHPFFPDVRVCCGGVDVRRSRVVMASKLGRPLRSDEIVHHINEDRSDDRPENLEILAAAEHNTHHKTGSTHSEASKAKIAESLRKAHADGRHKVPVITVRDTLGRIVQCE